MEFTPVDPELKRVWERLSPKARQTRLEQAQRRLQAVEDLQARPPDESERAAAARVAPWADRTAVRKWRELYKLEGFEGLIDLRTGKPLAMPEKVREAVITLRQSDPNYPVPDIVAHVLLHHQFKTSESSVRRVLRGAGLARRGGPPPGRGPVSSGEARLQLGGMKLVEAALLETGYLSALARGIQEHVADLPRPAEPVMPDNDDRDEYGRFLPSYNRRYIKGTDDSIGPGFASVEVKREGLDPDRLRLSGSKLFGLESKLIALMAEPVLGNGRLERLRSSTGLLLSEVCGFPYMPATLDKMTRELKYAGASSTLWEIHARKWLELNRLWEEEAQQAVLYVDGVAKPLWTDQFTKCAKVSSVGRVMPALEHVAFHTGSGTPLWLMTFSGHAPLVKVVQDGLSELERFLGATQVGRIIVIDAEGNAVPFLKGLEQGEHPRGWVTCLKGSLLKGKKLTGLGEFLPYRDGDRIRAGETHLNDPDGGEFKIRVVEIERRSSGKVTRLGASVLLTEESFNPEDLGDLYFQRWPAQEANFRAVNQAAKLKQVHGYGKQLVSNISVVTKLSELSDRRALSEERHLSQTAEVAAQEKELAAAQEALKELERSRKGLDKQIKSFMKSGGGDQVKGQTLLKSQQESTSELASTTKKVDRAVRRLNQARERVEHTGQQLEKNAQKATALKGREEIIQQDVELDSFFTLLKVGLVMIVTYVLREYLGHAPMEATTFLERVAKLHARVRLLPKLELLTFEYNARDPEVMALLAASVDRINARGLRTRSGRVLRIAVDPAPEPARPPPPGGRRKIYDRIKP